MKRTRSIIIVLSLVCSSASLAQKSELGMQHFTKGKCVLQYAFMNKNDSSFIYGQVKERRTERAVIGINIILMGFPIGTVSDSDGNFQLFLPVRQGTLFFEKTGFTSFEFPFIFKKNNLKIPSAHH